MLQMTAANLMLTHEDTMEEFPVIGWIYTNGNILPIINQKGKAMVVPHEEYCLLGLSENDAIPYGDNSEWSNAMNVEAQ